MAGQIIPDDNLNQDTNLFQTPPTTKVDEGLLSDISSEYEDLAPAPTISEDMPEYIPAAEGDLGVVKPGSSYLTPEALVSSQFNTLIQEDSPLIQEARRRADEQSQARGLLSSSAAMNRSQRAAYEAALPIAQADAATYATFQGREQAGELAQQQVVTEGAVSSALKGFQTQLDQSTNAIQNEFTAALKGADIASQVHLTDFQARWDQDTKIKMQTMSEDLQMKMQANAISQEQYNASLLSMSQISQNTQTAIAQLIASPDFMSGGAEAARTTFNNLLDQASASMDFIGSVGNIEQENLAIILENYKNATQWN